jgi:hypothetical protein
MGNYRTIAEVEEGLAHVLKVYSLSRPKILGTLVSFV